MEARRRREDVAEEEEEGEEEEEEEEEAEEEEPDLGSGGLGKCGDLIVRRVKQALRRQALEARQPGAYTRPVSSST